MKINFSYLDQFWQQEESQLTSADVSYQMVGLCDYKNVMFSYVWYIWVSFSAKLKKKRVGWPCS